MIDMIGVEKGGGKDKEELAPFIINCEMIHTEVNIFSRKEFRMILLINVKATILDNTTVPAHYLPGS